MNHVFGCKDANASKYAAAWETGSIAPAEFAVTERKATQKFTVNGRSTSNVCRRVCCGPKTQPCGLGHECLSVQATVSASIDLLDHTDGASDLSSMENRLTTPLPLGKAGSCLIGFCGHYIPNRPIPHCIYNKKCLGSV